MKITLLATATLAVLSGCLAGQDEPKSGAAPNDERFMATVHVLAFEARGTFLGNADVRLFESEDHKDLASAFHAGVAEHIPFGVYRVEARMSGFYSEVRYVAVYQRHVTVIVGLPFGRESLTLPIPARLHGKVVGSFPGAKKGFVKLTGLFSNKSLESSIATDGGFDFSIPWDGRYLLLVIDEDGVLASQAIDIPYSGPPLEIRIGTKSESPVR